MLLPLLVACTHLVPLVLVAVDAHVVQRAVLLREDVGPAYGRIQIVKDPETGLYLFPDEPATLEMLKDLKDGNLKNLRFS